ncbi:hypothetical protein [Rhodococcus sp. NPDC049939]|uniref:hypothetical protein n=1 Tax=Rhodococcus sp. NPDC049939 TaxID=3155511 RepID=UPI0033D20D07
MTIDDEAPGAGERGEIADFGDLAVGDLIRIYGIGSRTLVVGRPQQYTDSRGATFHIVEVVLDDQRPTRIVLDANSHVHRVPFRGSRYEFEFDTPVDGRGQINAWLKGRRVGEVSWRKSDGVVLDISPRSPHDPLRQLLISCAQESCPILKVPDPAVRWTPDPDDLVPGDLILLRGMRVVVGCPQSYTDPDGRRFWTVATEGDLGRSETMILDAETQWRRTLFDASRYRFEVRSRGEGLRTARAVTSAGSRSAAGEVTWWSGDGSIHGIEPANPLHPLHRLLTEWVREQPLITSDTDPDVLDVGDVVLSEGRQMIVTGHQVRGSRERQRKIGVAVYPVLFADTGEVSTMTFDLTVPVVRDVFDSSTIRFEISDESGTERSLAALSATGARLGMVRWREANGAVTHIAPEHPRNPVHRLLFERAKQLCPTLRGPMPHVPARDNPVERIAAREAFVSSLDAGPDILGAHYMTEGTVDGPWNLLPEERDALRAAWQWCRTRLYVVFSFNGESGTDVYTPLAWAVPEEALYLPDVVHEGASGRHLEVVQRAAELPVPDYLD